MNPDPNNQPVLENIVVDGGDPTDQEKELMEQGLEDKPDTDAAAADGKAGDAGKDGAAAPAADKGGDDKAGDAPPPDGDAPEPEVDAAAKAEADRLASEQAAADERDAAEAKANADVIARAGAAEKPAPPVDFDAAFNELKQQREDDDISEIEFADKMRDLTRQEATYTVKLGTWEAEQTRLADDAKAATARAENAWNAAALQWEADNTEFMANPLRAQRMQEAINLVISNNAKAGKSMGPAAVLAEAGRIAFDFVGYKTEPATPAVDPKQKIAEAVQGRKEKIPDKTLGDVPNAGNEPIRGDEAFANLDRMSIEDLEETVQHMTPAQQEKYLRDAPGAKANGRGDDPRDTDAA